MIDGRHCTKKDLDLLVKETKKIKKSLQNPTKIANFLDLVERFDKDIADKLRRQIDASNGDYQKIEQAIEDNINALIQNVYVDMLEHQ